MTIADNVGAPSEPKQRRRGQSDSRLVRFVRRWVARAGNAIGLTGTEGGQQRFVAVAFGLRFLFVAITPVFFRLGVKQYGFAATRWNWFAAVAIENVLFAFLALRRFEWLSNDKWGRWVRIADFLFAFVVFFATTRSSTGAGVSISSVVVVGAFQLQTYGPVITLGALEGVWSGVVAGVVGAVLYPLCLVGLGRSWGGLFGTTQLANTIGRSAMYVFLGVVFGLLSDFVARLIHHRQKFRAVVQRRIDATRKVLEAENEAKLLDNQIEHARRLEQDAYHVLHRRGLSELRQLIDDLTKVTNRNQRTLAKQFVQGRLVPEIEGITENMASHLKALRRIGAGLPADSSYATDVVQFIVANQKLRLFNRRSKPVVYSESGTLGEPTILIQEQVADLDWILREGIRNGYYYANDGTISVNVSAREADGALIIEIADCGPRRNGRRRRRLKQQWSYEQGVGHRDCLDRANRHGWTWHFSGAEGPGAPSRFTLTLGPAMSGAG